MLREVYESLRPFDWDLHRQVPGTYRVKAREEPTMFNLIDLVSLIEVTVDKIGHFTIRSYSERLS